MIRSGGSDLDVAVVGAGVVGLAIGAELATRLERVVVFERHKRVGSEISSRNSEVVHAGIYYHTDSLKAITCVEGRRMLYSFADRAGIGYRKVGKLIVAACDDEIGSLEALYDKGRHNGVEGLRLLSASEVEQREPVVRARAALLSPETGIIDSHGLLSALSALVRDRGANVVLGAPVRGLERRGSAWRVAFTDSGGGGSVVARAVVNAAGLGAQEVMRMAGIDDMSTGLQLHLCRGQYFDVRGPLRRAIRSLIYPSPDADLAGLGIHTVADLSGGLRLGPDATYVSQISYDVDPQSAAGFAMAVRSFLPSIREEDLSPAMVGIRPKLAGPGEPARDFYVAHEADRGVPGFFNLAGIESPGLTSCLAIGSHVSEMVADYLQN